MSIRLSGIFVYPVKGMRGVSLATADVRPRGLADDRRWVVTDEGGRFLSQRSHPALARLSARVDRNGLILRASGRPDLAVPRPVDGPPLRVGIWRDEVDARLAPVADTWLAAVLGEPCRLAWMPPDAHRPVAKPGAPVGATVSFADAAPCLVVGKASLDELNRRLETPVPMDRFRANLVVSGGAPFAEDDWTDVVIGGATLRAVGPCARCQVTTVDQDDGTLTGPEPLRTLATFRRRGDGVDFGVNLAVVRPGRIAVGDPVRPVVPGPGAEVAADDFRP